jgi:hypothetical protein
MSIINAILNKLFSGRFLLTMCGGYIWIYLTIHDKIPVAFTTACIATLFKDYFERKDRSTKGVQNG